MARGLVEYARLVGTWVAAMTAPTLRPYQAQAVDQIRAAFSDGARRVLHVSPTGSGKTVEFVFVVGNAVARGRRVLVLTHRQELIDQISAALAQGGQPHGILAPGCA